MKDKSKRAKLSVDNASSVLVSFRVMRRPYEIEYRGARIKCNSLQAALDLLHGLGEDTKQPKYQEWTADELVDFTSKLQPQPAALLEYLLKVEFALDEQLREFLEIPTNRVLAGILSGISKVAQSLDIEPARVYEQTTKYRNGKPVRYYRVNPRFKEAAIDNDWPPVKKLGEITDEDIPD